MSDFPLADLLGLRAERGDPGRGSATIAVTPTHHNPHGVVHGAVVFALVDTAMGAAVTGLLPEGATCATIEVQVRFLRPVTGGPLVAEAEVVHPGRRILHLESRVRDADDRLVALATGSFAVLSPPTD
ncbi:MAG: PaaI family thioesterase [Acidimicrobiales bacterium]|nr:PaaI family thioesterase [Acidimicrobiales bacterium]